jgi:hypothetical protein
MWDQAWSRLVLSSNLNGLLLAFVLPFFPRHGDGRRDCPDWSQDNSDAKKKFILMWFLLNTADCSQNLILHNHAKGLSSLQYSIKVDLDMNQLCWGQNWCIMGNLHYGLCIIAISTVYIWLLPHPFPNLKQQWVAHIVHCPYISIVCTFSIPI